MQRIAESLPPPKHKRSTDAVFSEPQRLHKVLASCGFGSRRAMEEMILAGRITVNRMPAEVGMKVGPGDEVRINGELVRVRFAEPRPRVLIYHKPTGELVTRDDPEGRPTVFEQLPPIGAGKWISVGRLDYNSEGLLLFTNHGELANRLMHPRYEVEREYAVRVMGRLSDEQTQKLTTGIELADGIAKCEKVEDAGGDEDGANHWYRVTLKEGRNREIRRLFEALGLMVSRLIRTRYGALAMPPELKRGQWTELGAEEVNALVASSGMRGNGHPQNAQQRPPQGPRHRGHPRGGHPQGSKQGGHQQRPHGPNGQRRHGKPHGPHAQAASPHANRHGGGAPGGAQGQPHDARRVHRGKPQPRHNFDEVQPQSNANASPFGRHTLTVPGGHARTKGQGGGRNRRGNRTKGAGMPADLSRYDPIPNEDFSRPKPPRREVIIQYVKRDETPPRDDEQS